MTPPSLPVSLYFYAKNRTAARLMVDELNTWTEFGVEARLQQKNCVLAVAERAIIDDEGPLDAVAERFGGYFDGYGTAIRE